MTDSKSANISLPVFVSGSTSLNKKFHFQCQCRSTFFETYFTAYVKVRIAPIRYFIRQIVSLVC